MNVSQFLALIQLRFRLSINQIRKGGAANSILFSIISIALILYVVASFAGSILLGSQWMEQRSTEQILAMWNVVVVAFLFMWTFHFMNRIMQNDAISIDKLLHLPITFHGAFLLNYVSSFANLTLLAIAPTVLGLAIATPIARGGPSAVAIPLSLSFLFVVTAVTYQLRSWAAVKMENKRTKALLMGILPLVMVAVFLGLNSLADSGWLSDPLKTIAFGWLPSGIVAADAGDPMPGVWGTLAMTAIGCGSLFFAFKTSMRKFTGEGERVTPRETKTNTASNQDAWQEPGLFSSLPYLSGPVAATALCCYQSFKRAPEIFAALLPFLVLAAFGSPYLIGMEGFVVPIWLVEYLPMGLIAVALLGFPAFLFSTFSYDRDGFRAFLLAPVERKDILLGKNLAIGLPTVVLGWLTLIALQVFFPMDVFWFLGHMIQMPASYLLLCVIGNVITVFSPVGLKRGSMTPMNARVIPVVALYFGILVGPFIALMPMSTAQTVVTAGEFFMGREMGWLYLLLSIATMLGAWFVYLLSVKELGRYLWQNESKILDIVANVPE